MARQARQANFANEAARLRGLVKDGADIWFTRHAEQELEKDGVDKIDVVNMLGRCVVTLVEQSRGEETWRAEGKDVDGRPLVAVVVPYEDSIEVKVITGWAG